LQDNAYQAAAEAKVLERTHIDPIKDELEAIQPMKAVFFPEYVKRLRGENIKTQTNKKELAEAARQDIRDFKRNNQLERCVAVWCGSTEVHHEMSAAHMSLAAFEKGPCS
jgi:myo-inositol-1-phosphate synthase